MIIYILYIIVYIPIVLSFRFLPYLGKFPWPGATTGRGVHTSALGSRGEMMDFTERKMVDFTIQTWEHDVHPLKIGYLNWMVNAQNRLKSVVFSGL